MVNSAFSGSSEEEYALKKDSVTHSIKSNIRVGAQNLESKIPRQLATANSSFRVTKSDLSNSRIPVFGSKLAIKGGANSNNIVEN